MKKPVQFVNALLITALIASVVALGADVYRLKRDRAAPSERMAKIDARLHQLRVAEYRGALFEQMALDYVRGEPVDLARQIAVAHAAAEKVGNDADEFSRAALHQAAREFSRAVEEARKK